MCRKGFQLLLITNEIELGPSGLVEGHAQKVLEIVNEQWIFICSQMDFCFQVTLISLHSLGWYQSYRDKDLSAFTS